MTGPDGIRIRPMTVGDLDAVLSLERDSDSAPHWSEAEYLHVIEDHADSALRRCALAAELSGSFAGFAVVRLLAAPDGREAELESIVVAPALRGRRVGTALLEEIIHWARAQGAERLDLEVRASNTTAIRLYERMGLRETGRRRGYYRHPDEEAVLMHMNLCSG